MASSQLDCALDLCRRLPPQRIEANLETLIHLLPDLQDDLLGAVDQPLKLLRDSTGREYLGSEYNRDQDSYRSPWTNEYTPPLSGGTQPSPKLRKLEENANDAFDVYREMYYDGGTSSVYLWDADDGFAGAVLLKKTLPSTTRAASWDSIHVFEAFERGRTVHYKLTSTIIMHTTRSDDRVGKFELGGSLTRQTEQDASLDPNNPASHVSNIGRLVEDMELKMRSLLEAVYGSKTKDIVNDLRSLEGATEGRRRATLQGELVNRIRKPSTTDSI